MTDEMISWDSKDVTVPTALMCGLSGMELDRKWFGCISRYFFLDR